MNKDSNIINYNQPWQELNIDVSNAVLKDFDPEQLRLNSDQVDKIFATWVFRDDEMLKVLDKEWLEYLASIGLPVSSFVLIYREPNTVYPEVHVDVFRTGKLCIYSVNWVISPNDDSFMTWYDLPFDTGTHWVGQEHHYRYWQTKDVEDKEIARHTIGNKLTLINVGIPHNVIVNTQPRWLISLRLKPNLSINNWKDAVDHFKYNLKLL